MSIKKKHKWVFVVLWTDPNTVLFFIIDVKQLSPVVWRQSKAAQSTAEQSR